MTPRVRRLALTSHVTSSVGWLGAVVAYLVISIVGLTSLDIQLVRATYLSMQVMAWWVIVPFALASLVSGLVQSLGTEWGLFRHYWVLAKLAITTVGTAILLLHAPRVTEMAKRAAESSFATGDYTQQRIALVIHAVGGISILLVATALSVFKPWGKTAHGKGDVRARGRYLWFAVGAVIVTMIVLHLLGAGPRGH